MVLTELNTFLYNGFHKDPHFTKTNHTYKLKTLNPHTIYKEERGEGEGEGEREREREREREGGRDSKFQKLGQKLSNYRIQISYNRDAKKTKTRQIVIR